MVPGGSVLIWGRATLDLSRDLSGPGFPVCKMTASGTRGVLSVGGQMWCGKARAEETLVCVVLLLRRALLAS